MRCPICGHYEQTIMEIKSDQFKEGLAECATCGSSWSIQHGHADLIIDTQLTSFLEGQSECVEADDYTWAA